MSEEKHIADLRRRAVRLLRFYVIALLVLFIALAVMSALYLFIWEPLC